ncbi:MAG: hypothetical protein JSS63_15105 [Bacteroidetes bacterium]|nr:hypothetical protein [Bacteroidota bacterium]MBX7046234.1 hypothetical protein [Ignavibacteria bacterium]
MLHKFKFFSAVSICLLIIFSCGNSGEKSGKYKISLSGTDKLRYTGYYKTISPNGAIRSNTVEGVLPAEYFLEDCKSLVCSFQKEAERGELRMIITDENGNELRNEFTAMSYGSVQLTTDF